MALYRVNKTEEGLELERFLSESSSAFNRLRVLAAKMVACGDDLEKFETVFGVPQADAVAVRTLLTTLLGTQSLTQNLTAVLTQIVVQ
jgi:hypothetical protein